MLRLTSDDIRMLTAFRHDLHQNPEMTKEAIRCVERTMCSVMDAVPSLASEDFALYGKYVPSFFFWIGSRMAGADIHELHTPQFFADDSAIKYAAELYAACAVR